MAFQALGLNDRLVQGILATGYSTPTEIQARAIPLAVAGKDIIGSAQTGTGKTAAFTLPILNRLAEQTEKSHHIKALILTPTRELAQQIEDAVKQYGRFLPVKALSIYGGTNIQNQLKQLSRGVDILIATPGRLIDHLERRSVNLSNVEVLVLDEADRMFDMGFIDDMRLIIKQTPATRQTLLFSATMGKEIRALVKNIQKNPELIEVGHQRTPATTVTQHFYTVNDDKKLSLLLHILQTKELDCVLVFSKTKVGAERVSNNLHKNGIKAISIHSDRTQAQRQRALAGFKQGQYKVLVATDVAARGIDVEGISHVINYDIPTYAEDYIHRIGRTGRALSTGDALTFVTRNEARHVKKIEQFIGKKFEIKKYPDFDYNKVEEKPVKLAGSDHQSNDEPNFNREHRGENRDRFKRNDRGTDRRSSFGSRPDRREGFKRDDRRTGSSGFGSGEKRSTGYPKRDSFGSGERKEGGYAKRESFGGDRKEGGFPRRDSFGGARKEGGFPKRDSFGGGRRDSGYPKRESFGGERKDSGFVKRESFGGERKEGGYAKRESFGGERRSFGKKPSFGGERKSFAKRDSFGAGRREGGFAKREPFDAQKREHSFEKRESFTETRSFDRPKPHGGPDWKTLIPEEREFKPREHKVVRKMVSRKKKD
ncbi:MAG: DEAD/DEAH box helicase [Bacteroidota bacterium]|nr:DEAD/DEAH box helicase [Bacteroidota bacterium]